ncbi:Flagellar motor protein [Roseovarius sp. EC-HK134]|uniref:peptidoglycan -binding protein n=1 Tax=Roseovarius TaxID=74030 RepID=UPI00125C7C95|nr:MULTISPECIES: peptidoglycan -binding protein [Roseovarius]MBW4973562.1 peptidoglycan -binding protein [Roseovarius mucosus]VVS97411.1 Flagellar motor protein [Roseovarius sp. EC-HK134]VVS99452.1 Flagellar motor protein [Roseovarius sp. EC-SD190]
MALSRRSGARLQSSIWPGFVDAMTGLLLVLMFVLTIFMMVQFVLREEISGQATKLDALSAEVAALSLALGLEQDRSAGLESRVGTLTATLDDARTREAAQAEALRVAQGRIASFEEQVAGLLAERETAQGRISDLETARAELLSEQEQLQLALAGLRDEVDAQAEAARLAAARREALEALAADLRQRNADAAQTQAVLEQRLSAEEQARLAEAAAAEALRARLTEADAELTAMTLALEEQRKRAEETLTLLAAAETARADLNSQLAQALLDAEQGAAAQEADIARLRGELDETRDVAAQSAQEAQAVRDQLVAALAAQRAAEAAAATQMTEAETRAALLAEARSKLSEEAAQATEAQKQQALLNQQVAALRQQLSGLQALLDESKAREAETEVQLQSLGNELNTALARVAAEERRRRIAEEERARLLEAEKEDLEKYRSEFFGRLRDVLGQQQGVQIVGDRFVFSSEVLFAPGEADLSAAGQSEIAKVAGILRNVIGDIPEGIDWVLQVDGHTDNVPIIEGARFADNWALSQARALSVVRYLTGALGFPAGRLSANGYGEFQPVNPEDTPAARAQNRRIELKLTTR